jgi:hypothetical protein
VKRKGGIGQQKYRQYRKVEHHFSVLNLDRHEARVPEPANNTRLIFFSTRSLSDLG